MRELGFSVAVLELRLVQPDLLERMVALAEDWHYGRAMVIDFPNSYSNFSLIELLPPRLHRKLDDIAAGSDVLAEQSRNTRPRLQEELPSAPSARASVASSASEDIGWVDPVIRPETAVAEADVGEGAAADAAIEGQEYAGWEGAMPAEEEDEWGPGAYAHEEGDHQEGGDAAPSLEEAGEGGTHEGGIHDQGDAADPSMDEDAVASSMKEEDEEDAGQEAAEDAYDSFPPPLPPQSAASIARSSSSVGHDVSASIAKHGLPTPPPAPPADPLSEHDLEICYRYELDDSAIASLRRLAAVSNDKKNSVLGKLLRKSDIGKPSQFVTVACRNHQIALAERT